VDDLLPDGESYLGVVSRAAMLEMSGGPDGKGEYLSQTPGALVFPLLSLADELDAVEAA